MILLFQIKRVCFCLKEFNFYKNQMMEVSFNNVNWIFAVLPKTGNVIEYTVKNNEEVMDLLLRESKAGKTNSSISLSHNDALSGNRKSITFPIVDVNTIKNFKYNKEREEKDKLFQTKVNELKSIFEKQNLDNLQALKFEISDDQKIELEDGEENTNPVRNSN